MSTSCLEEHPWVEVVAPNLILFTLPQEPSDEDMRAVCDGLNAWLPARTDYYAFVTDLRRLERSKMAQRRLLSQTLKSLSPHANRWCAGNARVVDSSLAQGVAAAYTFLMRAKYPEKSFRRVSDAIDWARTQLTAFEACRKPAQSG
ncbi:MAG: hypothetical protein OXR73_08415 [Myxococcales bacterium]|nr:hypothetical protein [Myxococcales bacterium]